MDTASDSDYTFDAPMFVDFTAPKFAEPEASLNESAADVWFGASAFPPDPLSPLLFFLFPWMSRNVRRSSSRMLPLVKKEASRKRERNAREQLARCF